MNRLHRMAYLKIRCIHLKSGMVLALLSTPKTDPVLLVKVIKRGSHDLSNFSRLKL